MEPRSCPRSYRTCSSELMQAPPCLPLGLGKLKAVLFVVYLFVCSV